MKNIASVLFGFGFLIVGDVEHFILYLLTVINCHFIGHLPILLLVYFKKLIYENSDLPLYFDLKESPSHFQWDNIFWMKIF